MHLENISGTVYITINSAQWNISFTIWNRKSIYCLWLHNQLSLQSIIRERERKRERDRRLIKRGRSGSARIAASRQDHAELLSHPPPHFADERSRFFRNSTPTPGWFIRIINRRDSHVETRATLATFVGGRTRQLYATHAGRARFVHVKVLDHVTNLRAPIFSHAYNPLDPYPEKVFY